MMATTKRTAKQLAGPGSGVPMTVDAYISGFPADVQVVLRTVRATIRAAAPNAEERISYRMPAYFQDGVVVYFAGFKQHIGLYPPVRDPQVRARVARYAGPKGNLQFPSHEPMPRALITAVVKAQVKANAEKAARKAGSEKAATSRSKAALSTAKAAGAKRPAAKSAHVKPARSTETTFAAPSSGLTEHEFRRIALALEGAVEGAHMGHPDFRVHNRIFASLHHDRTTGGLMLNPEQQAELLRAHPDAFTPASGAWGRGGATVVRLAAVSDEVLGEALTLAWQNAVAKGPTRSRAKTRTPARTRTQGKQR